MSSTYRIKTKEEFQAEGRLTAMGIPVGWNNVGKMNHFMGKILDDDKIKFSRSGGMFQIDGEIWSFDTKDLVNLHTGSLGTSSLPSMSMTPIILSTTTVPIPAKKERKPKASAITEGRDAYGETVYIGDTIVTSPSSYSIIRGVVVGFTPKGNPRVHQEGTSYIKAQMRPYVKVYLPLNGKRMIDLIDKIK